jgi:hypothetical protein
MRWLFLLSFFFCQINDDDVHRHGKIKGGIYMRKKDYEKGLAKRVAALMVVCTLILTMTPVAADEDENASSEPAAILDDDGDDEFQIVEAYGYIPLADWGDIIVEPGVSKNDDGDVEEYEVCDTITDVFTAMGEANTNTVTISLLNDICENITIPSGYDITLNLNGKSFSNPDNDNNPTITVSSGAKLTLVDEETDFDQKYFGDIFDLFDDIDDLFDDDDDDDEDDDEGFSLSDPDGENEVVIQKVIACDDAAEITGCVNNKSNQAAISNQGTVVIEGGTYHTSLTADGSGTYTISGGKFVQDFTNAPYDSWIKEGYSAVYLSEEKMYEVKSSSDMDQAAASIGTAKFQKVQDAIDASTPGSTITLLADVAESITVPDGKNITLALNGKTITNTEGNHTITVNSGGILTVTGDGTVNNVSDGWAAVYNNGTTTITGGTFVGTASAVAVSGTAATAISGGSFSSLIADEYISKENVAEGQMRVCVYDPKAAMYVIKEIDKTVEDSELKTTSVTAGSSVDKSELTGEDKTAAAILATAANVKVDGLGAEKANNADEIFAQKKDNLEAAATKMARELALCVTGIPETAAIDDDSISPTDIQIFTKVYTEITPTGCSTEEGSIKYELIITPKVQFIAATGNVTQQNIIENEFTVQNQVKKITVESSTDGGTAQTGAVLLDEEKITVTGSTTITVPVPSTIVEKSDTSDETSTRTLCVKHELSNSNSNEVKYYKAAVGTDKQTKTEDQATYSYYDVTFTNPDGFSKFTIEEDPGELEVTIGSATNTYWLNTIGALLPTTDANGSTVLGWSFSGYENGAVQTAMTDGLYHYLLSNLTNGNVAITAKYAATVKPNSQGGNTTQTTASAAQTTVSAAQTTDEAAGSAADTTGESGNGNAADTTAQNDTNGTLSNREVTIVNPEVVEEEEHAAQIEESVVTEEVAEVEGGDLTADEADGGVIVETVGNSSTAWIWLLVVLACAAAAILLLIVFKRRKDEEA